MLAAFLIVMGGFSGIGALLAICACVVGASADVPDRPLPGDLGSSDWPELDEWERHCATTPGLTDSYIEACDVAMWELEMDGADS